MPSTARDSSLAHGGNRDRPGTTQGLGAGENKGFVPAIVIVPPFSVSPFVMFSPFAREHAVVEGAVERDGIEGAAEKASQFRMPLVVTMPPSMVPPPR